MDKNQKYKVNKDIIGYQKKVITLHFKKFQRVLKKLNKNLKMYNKIQMMIFRIIDNRIKIIEFIILI